MTAKQEGILPGRGGGHTFTLICIGEKRSPISITRLGQGFAKKNLQDSFMSSGCNATHINTIVLVTQKAQSQSHHPYSPQNLHCYKDPPRMPSSSLLLVLKAESKPQLFLGPQSAGTLMSICSKHFKLHMLSIAYDLISLCNQLRGLPQSLCPSQRLLQRLAWTVHQSPCGMVMASYAVPCPVQATFLWMQASLGAVRGCCRTKLRQCNSATLDFRSLTWHVKEGLQ